MIRWQDIEPADARGIDLSVRLDITAPLNEEGNRCPWPWDPQTLVGQPLGQYHCPWCGAMVVAGLEHPDYDERLIQRWVEEAEAGYDPAQLRARPRRTSNNDDDEEPPW